MGQTLYFRLFLIALYTVSECIQRRYHYVTMNKNWIEAQSYCRQEYTDLATVNNMNEMKQLMKSVNNQNVNVWIGLQNTGVHKWKWSLGDPVDYQNWNKMNEESSDESSVESSGQNNCAFLKGQKKKWYHKDCNKRIHLVCYNESSKEYIVEITPKIWRDAQRFCREQHTDLAIVRNQTENDEIMNLIKENQKPVWIGLFRDMWEWSDKSDYTFRNWGSSEPNGSYNEKCTEAVMNNGHWNDMSCNVSMKFVCHEDKLVLVRKNLSWPEALKYCREKHVDLVSVDSKKIEHWLAAVLKQASTAAVWLGLRHSCSVGIWFWVNGEIVCYDNWAPGNGTADEDCDSVLRSGSVQSEGDHRWISRPETEELNFICLI